MCVIVLQPKGKYLSKDLAWEQWNGNSHGAGFVYFTDAGVPVVYKSMVFNDFWAAFERARSDNRDKNFLLHFRIATHGTVDEYNVHPFQLPTGEWLAHNGIFHAVPEDPAKLKSDTQMFIEKVVPVLPARWYDTDYLADMVEEWMGWSKLVILDQTGEYYILNERKGTWFEGMWFSNSQSLPKPVVSNKVVYAPKLAAVPERKVGWDEAYSLYSQYPVDSALFKRALQDEREMIGLTKPIAFDYKSDEWYCNGCLVDLDVEAGGWCDCYDVYDTNCGRNMEDCRCPLDGVNREEINADGYTDKDFADDPWSLEYPSLLATWST